VPFSGVARTSQGEWRGVEAEPPAAGGHRGSGSKRWAIFAIFQLSNAFLCIFRPKLLF